MEAYSSFAQVYDLFMDNVPYEEWSKYVISLLKEEKIDFVRIFFKEIIGIFENFRIQKTAYSKFID